MRASNEQPVGHRPRLSKWKHAAALVCGCTAGIAAVLFFYPPAMEVARALFAQPAQGASEAGFVSPAEARKQNLSEAKTAVHGMYVKDPYGCVYMFQYVSAKLSLAPVLDEQKKQVCEK